MNKQSLVAIERVLTILKELNIITDGKNDDYFFERLEMNIYRVF